MGRQPAHRVVQRRRLRRAHRRRAAQRTRAPRPGRDRPGGLGRRARPRDAARPALAVSGGAGGDREGARRGRARVGAGHHAPDAIGGTRGARGQLRALRGVRGLQPAALERLRRSARPLSPARPGHRRRHRRRAARRRRVEHLDRRRVVSLGRRLVGRHVGVPPRRGQRPAAVRRPLRVGRRAVGSSA